MPGAWTHLAARLFDFLTARRLTDGERDAVFGWLDGSDAARAFFEQPQADQRHGFHAASQVQAVSPDRLDLIRAALLHDVGKRHCGLGAAGRVMASVAIRLRLPLPPRFALYRDHGVVAAAELTGVDEIVTDFARHHHYDRPPSIEPEDWELLVAADKARIR